MRFRRADATMRLHIDEPRHTADCDIQPGDYEVTVDAAHSTIVLSRDGAPAVRLEALARSTKAAVRNPSAGLRDVVGEPRRLLVARTPPSDEWVVSLDAQA